MLIITTTRLSLLIGLIVAAKSGVRSTVATLSRCQNLDHFAFLCTEGYNNLDPSVLRRFAYSMFKPEAIEWSEATKMRWTIRIDQACTPFNAILDCTEKSGARRWWHCNGINEAMFPSILSKHFRKRIDIDSKSEHRNFKAFFDALTDMCDADLSPDFYSKVDGLKKLEPFWRPTYLIP